MFKLLISTLGCLLVSFVPLISDASDDSQVIVIEKNKGRLKKDDPKVFVESGTEEIAGSPESNPKAAYRTWNQACQEWKAELQRLNGKNLMVSSCGRPVMNSETFQSEKSYVYRSKGTYKIRVSDK